MDSMIACMGLESLREPFGRICFHCIAWRGIEKKVAGRSDLRVWLRAALTWIEGILF